MGLNRRRIMEWVKVLESGAFKQTKGHLKEVNSRDEAAYCCLGIVCEMYAALVGGHWRIGSADASPPPVGFPALAACFVTDYQADIPMDIDKSYLPDSVAEWMGLTSDQQRILANLNDNGLTFAQIAQYIRRQLRLGGKAWESGDDYRDLLRRRSQKV